MNSEINDVSKTGRILEQRILEENKKKLWEVAKDSSKCNKEGQCVITKKDEDYSHHEREDDGK